MSENLTVVILRTAWSIESASPPCLKLLAWLKMAGIEHAVTTPKMAPESETGKAPYIVLEDGSFLADSQRIIEHLSKKHNIEMDVHLSAEQQAQALCLRRLFEDHYYFLIFYHRWMIAFDEIKGPYFHKLPALLKPIVPPMIRRQVKRDLTGQGTGKRSFEEVLMEAKVNLDAISVLLGDKDYFFNEPSSIDAVAFGYLENTINTPLESEMMRYAKTKENLVAFCTRFREVYFS